MHPRSRGSAASVTSFRRFDLLLVVGVAVMIAGVTLAAPHVRGADRLATGATQREALVAAVVAAAAVLLAMALVALLAARLRAPHGPAGRRRA